MRTEAGILVAEKVEYIITITREYSVWRGSETEGLNTVNGRVRVLQGEKWLLDKGQLILEMENGEQASFCTMKVIDHENAIFEISGGLQSIKT